MHGSARRSSSSTPRSRISTSPRADRANVEGVGDELKQRILDEGRTFVRALAEEGNTDEGFDQAFDVLGDLGLYMAVAPPARADEPGTGAQSPHEEATALGLHIGASVGVVPRFATSHLRRTTSRATAARRASRHCPTSSSSSTTTRAGSSGTSAQRTRSCGSRRSASRTRSPRRSSTTRTTRSRPSGGRTPCSSPSSTSTASSSACGPYYKPYRVGRQEYRGANAGDFSGINEIDLLLGLCRGNDPYYSQLLVEKMLFMRPEDQESLRDCLRRRSFLDQFLDALGESGDSGVVPAQRRGVPARLRGARPRRRTAPRPARRAVHRAAVERARREPPRADHRKRPAAAGPPRVARGAARPAARGAARRHPVAPRRRRAPARPRRSRGELNVCVPRRRGGCGPSRPRSRRRRR